ncbi:MAG: methyltransferase domain-containing protein [Solirubrobacterales bacterium]
MSDLDVIKDRQRHMWTIGDYAAIAEMIEGASEAAVDRAGASEGKRVLDVATGTGNAALIAARRGADVTGLDLTPKLIEIAGERAREAGVEAEFIVGDAENLPFDDDSFDCVTSVFGVMFAPHQQRAADELRRVCRPGGRVVTCAWTPAGLNGRMFGLIGANMPPPPEGFQPPVLWGTEERVNELFAGERVTCETLSVPFRDDSIEDWMTRNERILGPTVMAKEVLEVDGKWEPLREQLTALYADANEASDGSMHVEAEYLLAAVDVA